ncbi:MAG: exonuclease [Dehalococcoidia bacterium]|jgi:hypothetical protein
MSLFVLDVESDGQVIGKNSMVCFGAVRVDLELKTTFYGKVRPISEEYNPDALAVSGFSREEHEKFDDPFFVMDEFAKWLNENSKGRPILISDNNGYDASWINYYFHVYHNSNPFGWSSRRIGDLYCGAEHDMFYSWKKHRVTKHTHNPVDDAKGNAEALMHLFEKYNFKWPK